MSEIFNFSQLSFLIFRQETSAVENKILIFYYGILKVFKNWLKLFKFCTFVCPCVSHDMILYCIILIVINISISFDIILHFKKKLFLFHSPIECHPFSFFSFFIDICNLLKFLLVLFQMLRHTFFIHLYWIKYY